MENIRQRIHLPRFVLVPFGAALVVLSYSLAGGYDRAVPVYDSNYGCNFGAVDSLTFIQPHGRIETYSHYEWLGCLPPHYVLLYGLGILGVIICGWALALDAKRLFLRQPNRKEDFFNDMVTFFASPLLVGVGVWMLHPQISFGFGGGFYTLGDVFDTLSEVLVIMGVIGLVIMLWAFMAQSRGKSLG